MKPIDYSKWINNIILVIKPTGDIHVYTDFRYINNIYPKYDFPLPNINMIIDNITDHDILSFIDGCFGYNQIFINLIDHHKITFTTPWGDFCWKFIPFGLKNTGATYQRDMVSMFHEHIHKMVELYVDDNLVKYKQNQDYLLLLDEVFQIIKRYKLRLKIQKYIFGVTYRKLLDFIFSHRGIEVDPKKVKAIVSMPP